MSEDARNSLFAFACVSLIFGAGYLLEWLMPDDLVLPSWIGLAALPVILFTQLLTWLLRRRRRRSQRTHRRAMPVTPLPDFKNGSGLARRAAALKRLSPALIGNVQLYATAAGGRTTAVRPGWGCPCMTKQQQPLSGYDGWPLLDEPLHPGEHRVGVPFVFLSPEAGEVMKETRRFFLWEGRFIGEAFVVSQSCGPQGSDVTS